MNLIREKMGQDWKFFEATKPYVLLGHFAQCGSVVVGKVAHGVVERKTGLMSTLAVLVVADLVNGEEKVDEVAGGAELLVAGIGVSVCAEELAATLEEEGTLLVGQNAVRVDPLRGLGGGFGVVGVE